MIVSAKVTGIPYCRNKSRGDREGRARWMQSVAEQTSHLPAVSRQCLLKVTFLLPADKFPTNLPHGPDLDNLLKLTLDALQQTVFKDAPGKDSCVVSLMAMKTRVEVREEAGAHIEILTVT